MSTYQRQAEQEHPFFVLSEASPGSHSPSHSPFFVRTIDMAIESSASTPQPSAHTQDITKRDDRKDTSVAGVAITSLLGVVQIGLQAKGNHIATASLQLAQAIATTEHGHRAVEAVGAAGMSGALRGANKVATGVSALQQRAGATYRGILAIVNPFQRDAPIDIDEPNMNNEEGLEENEAADDRFAIGSDCSDDEMDTLDGIQIEEANPWAEEGSKRD